MRKLFLLFAVILCSFLTASGADNNNIYWTNAQKAYQAKQYDSAIGLYEKILSSQPTNARVFYNLGNAYYKNNEVGKAVLSYERALFLNPDAKEAKENLLLAKSRIPNAIRQSKDIFFIQWWKQSTAGNLAQTWAVVSLVVFLSFLALILLSLTRKSSFRIPQQTFILIPLVLLLFLFCAFTAANNKMSTSKAVVMGTAASLSSAPDVYKGQIVVPEATTVETGEKKGSWVEVTLPDNRTGWMKLSELTFVQIDLKKQ